MGTYESDIKIEKSSVDKIILPVPKDANNKQIHLIIEIKDDNKIAKLDDYRRVVLDVN